ncbi:hypothetical protein RUA4292_00330 [Ruegeria atlantica]|uniref:Uncharacterized protein n=1 Tax=Ruegeria atlantica TaxID=81569 RepID=A0A0P1EA41_9RHOB|nr:hypothetical protein RUA4292_00330 [Ruegeria atlantica]
MLRCRHAMRQPYYWVHVNTFELLMLTEKAPAKKIRRFPAPMKTRGF